MLSRLRSSSSFSVLSKRFCEASYKMPSLEISKTSATRHKGMMSLEKNLPKLPVPALQQTMDKYLNAVEALVDKEEFANTKEIVNAFRKPGGVGEMLQYELEAFARKKDNWLSSWWSNLGYLEQRVPLPIYYSPACTFPKEYFNNDQSYLKYAARVITNVLKFKKEVDNETLTVDMMGKDPLNMIQYKNLFSGVRVPRPSRDEFVQALKSRHILVAHQNQFFTFDVYDAVGRPLSESSLLSQLMRIVEDNDVSEPPVGVLTSHDRTSWATQSAILRKDRRNRSNIESIASAIFVICLDQPPVPSTQSPSTMEDATDSVTARQNLHGDGLGSNSMNRWYDKTLNFGISVDGHCGCLYEHTPAEAPPVGRLWDYVLENREGYESITPDQAISHLPYPVKLRWNLNSDTLEAIENAKYNIESLVNDTDIRCFKFDHYGKDFVKGQKMSPDAWIQIAFQLTHYRLHGCIAPAYETASTRKFLHGRTETIRSASIPTLKFLEGMANQSLTNSDKLKLMLEAVNAHAKYTKEAVNGQGIDRHLLGLKMIAIESGMTLPDLFMDSTYSYSLHFKLSTSQVPFKDHSYLLFGPAVPDGYGICYNPKSHIILFGITSFNSNPSTNCGHFAAYLRKSLDDMRLLTTKSKL